MFAFPWGSVAAAVAMIGGGTGATLYFVENQQAYTKNLQDQAGHVVDSVNDTYAWPAVRFVEAAAEAGDGLLQYVTVTYEVREASWVDPYNTILQVDDASGTHRVPLRPGADGRLALGMVQDPDASYERGELNPGDRFAVGLSLPALGVQVAPSGGFDLKFRPPGGRDLGLHVQAPDVFGEEPPVLTVAVL
jgi:hypothetical protein